MTKVKKLFFLLVIILQSLLLANSYVYGLDEGSSSNIGPPDALQGQYRDKLRRINLDLNQLYTEVEANKKFRHNQFLREMNELRYTGMIPSNVQNEKLQIENERTRLGSKISDLERQKEDLKLDALKVYNGKLPKWLSDEWDKLNDQHYQYIHDLYKEDRQ